MLEQIVKKLATKDVKKLTASKPDEDFLPYVCHYDKNTILTKNGELLQIIRITGLNGDSLAASLIPLRDSLRDAIYDNVKETDFAFWFHTIRRKKNINPKGTYQDFFSADISNKWSKHHNWEDNFVNELYITIISQGLETAVTDFKDFAKTFSYKSTQKIHHEHLQKSHKKLCELSEKILVEITEHGAKMLGIREWEGILYSEPMRFFGKIANLYEERYPLSVNDISNDLASHKIAFGEREIEVVGDGNKNFATLMTIKEYHEVSTQSLDKILQLPFEFIITQSFDFLFNKKDLETYLYQNHILKISEDEDFRQISGVANFVESNMNSKTDYGKLQSSIMVISNNRKDLEKDVAMMVQKFSSFGFILIREDIFLEHCFWAQLPANFSFLRRQKIINTLRIGGFAALNSFPFGNLAGNHWGNAIVTLKTVLNTPYFFNFHQQNCGHTLVLGPKSSGKTVITNFLLLMARKFNNKIFCFDFAKSSKVFIEALSGNYYKLTKNIEDKNFLQLNPLSLENSEENVLFLKEWLQQLTIFLKGNVTDEQFIKTEAIIRKILAQKLTNFLSLFDALRGEETKNVYEKLKIWGSGKLAYVFGSHDEIDFSKQINAFDFDEIIDKKPILIPVIFYLLHKIEQTLDGSPAIIIFERSREFLENQIFAQKLDGILKKLRAKNCMVIFNVEDNQTLAKSSIAQTIAKNVATEIYTPNSNAQEHYKTMFEIDAEEFEVVKIMEAQKHIFLLKHDNDSLIIDFDLSFLEEIADILSCDDVSLAAAEELLADEKNHDPAIWLPQLMEIIKEFKKQQQEELLTKQRVEMLKERQRKLDVEDGKEQEEKQDDEETEEETQENEDVFSEDVFKDQELNE